MATIQKRGDRYRAIVRVTGHPSQSKSFAKKSEAKSWASQVELEMKDGTKAAENKTFGDLLDRYRKEITPTHRGERWEDLRIKTFLRDKISSVRLSVLSQPNFVDWRNRRLKEVSDGSVLREWKILSSACNTATNEWKWLPKNPMKGVSPPKSPPPRERLPTQQEIENILVHLGYSENVPVSTISQRVGLMFLFAIETGMRAGEMVKLTWERVDIQRRVLSVVEGKTVSATRKVPLSLESIRLLERLDGTKTGTVFGISSASLDALFRKAKDKAGIVDLHFHDSRAEAITRLSKKLDILALARMIGHKDLGMLQVYYRETAEELASRL